MKMNLYAVEDKTAKVYSPIITQVNDDVAKRTVSAAVNNPEHNYGMFSEHYTLYCIGTYTDSNGEISPQHREICKLTELKLPEEVTKK